MWHVVSDGFGGFLLFEESPGADALAGGLLNLVYFGIAALVAWVCWALGPTLMLPLACVVLVILLLLLADGCFGSGGVAVGATTMIALPLIMYAWGSLCWGMIDAMDRYEHGYLAYFAYILFGIAMLAAGAGIGAELDNPIPSVIFAGAQLVLWWAAMGARSYGNDGVAFVIKYTFRVVSICALVGIVVLVGAAIHDRVRPDKASSYERPLSPRELVWYLGSTVVSFVPCVVAGLVAGAVPALFVGVGLLVAYMALAFGAVMSGRKGRVNLSGLVVGYLVQFCCYLVMNADMSRIMPLPTGEHVVGALRASGLVQVLASGFENLCASYAEFLFAVGHGAFSLVMRIFDASAPSFEVPPTMAAIIAVPLICWAITLGYSLAHRLGAAR